MKSPILPPSLFTKRMTRAVNKSVLDDVPRGPFPIRLLEVILNFFTNRSDYLNRIWTALFLPVLVTIITGSLWTSKMEALLLGIAVGTAYTVAVWVHRKYLQ